jgi:serine/threonine-protein kinase
MSNSDSLPPSGGAGVNRPPKPAADPNLSITHITGENDPAPSPGDDLPSLPTALGTSTSSGLRFHVLRAHARGGLGEVFVAYDEELHREVALKEIQPSHAGYEESRSRFLLEAEVTGRLEHPGVVPVYGLGRHADGRPFYAMRFIKGRSLREAIDRFHQAESPNRDPGERTLALRELLGRFVAVCNTVAYAHSRGVLHRDLKPDNVMLGPYGETLVVDWGLAKLMDCKGEEPREGEEGPGPKSVPDGVTHGSPTPDGATPEEPTALRAIQVFATQADTVLGTPGYISPEQAAGRVLMASGQVESVGPTSDIYSLGATLYVLLTGRPSVTGSGVVEVLGKAFRGEWLPPRQVKKDVPAPLEAICLKAMALKPKDRYDSALALAADIEHWLADEPVSAYREPPLARWGRWVRRHKPAVAATVTAILAIVLLGAGGALWLERQQAERREEQARQEERQRQRAEAALDKLPALLRQWRWKEAETVLGEADRHLGETDPADLRARAAQARADLTLAVQLDDIRLQRAAILEGKYDNEKVERDYAAAFQASDLGREGETVEGLAARIQNSAIKDQLVAALDDWAYARVDVTKDPERAAWLFRAARAADPDSWRDRFRHPMTWRDRFALAGLADELLKDEARLKAQSPHLLEMLGQALQWQQGDSVPLLTEARRQYPSDFWLNFSLGGALYATKKWEAAEGCLRVALALRPEAAVVYSNLGVILVKKGDCDEAIRQCRKALELNDKFAHARLILGDALRAKGQLDEGIQEHLKAIKLAPNDARAHNDLGNAFWAKGRLDEAIEAYRKAIRLDSKVAVIHLNLASILYDKGKQDEAIKEFRAAIQIDPTYALAHSRLGNALLAKGKLDEAVQEWRKAIELDDKLAEPHNNLGAALQGKGRLDEALQEYRKAVELDPKYALAHCNLGNILKAKDRRDEAIQEYQKAIALNDKLVQAHGSLGKALAEQGRFIEAGEATRRCLKLLPEGHPLRSVTIQQLRLCEQLHALEKRFPALLEGKEKAADSERVPLAWLCMLPHKRLYAASARFYAEAFDAQPDSAKNPANGIRYNAACAAALASCGKGEDAARLEEKERARLRRQALDWLRADLALWAKLADNNDPKAREAVQQKLKHWQADADFAGVRDKSALDKLPQAERAAWQKLWAEVEALRKKCGG